MTEPQWGEMLIQYLNNIISHNSTLFHIASSLADYPIFLLPIFLLWLYVWKGVIKKHTWAKYGALLIVVTAALTLIANLTIQHFVDKARPETALMSAGHLVMKHLPTASFPSDHAAVSFAVGFAALVWAGMYGKKKARIRGRVLIIASIIMSISRVAVGVHRPTDILAGRGVAIVMTLFVLWPPVSNFLKRYVLRYIIMVEESILGIFGIYKN